ncbi:serine protease [Pandoraea sp. NPDC087047]|uniref:S1 family peptidase n=1 Tax=Pandoraea sp. NPDC087047 TaxID=3364390 RepID=UPI003823492D
MDAFLGTAFNVGSGGALLTARHVIEGRDKETIMVLYVDANNEWSGQIVRERELCPTADVAVMKIEGRWMSIFECDGSWQGASMHYDCWGYPDDARFDPGAHQRPDLVYTTGYVRRHYSYAIPTVKGSQFFEISEVAGSGCSGAPIVHKTKRMSRGPVSKWALVGIYSVERCTEVHVGGVLITREIPYGVREEAFRDWAPQILGRTIMEESRT